MSRPRIIRASELAQYGYCARAWWLGSVMRVESANTAELQRGTAMHEQHGRAVFVSKALRVMALALAALAMAILIFALLS